MVLLSPDVVLYVHPVDTAVHTTVPPGWRWAVHAGGGRPGDVSRCANAGWTPTRQAALSEGEQNAATAVKVARAFGVPAAYRLLDLDYDPIPAGADGVTVLT